MTEQCDCLREVFVTREEIKRRLRNARRRLAYAKSRGASRTILPAGEAIDLAKADVARLTEYLNEAERRHG